MLVLQTPTRRPEVVGIAYASVPGLDMSSTAYLRICRLLRDSGAAYPAGAESVKRARTRGSSSSAFNFGDSPFLLEGEPVLFLSSSTPSLISFPFLATALAVDNAYANKVLDKAQTIVGKSSFNNGSELAIRKLEGELQAEIVCGLHKIEFLLKHRALLLEDLDKVQRRLEMVAEA